MRPYVDAVVADIALAATEAIAQLPQAQKIDIGWVTPDGTLHLLPAPSHFGRAQQIMVLATEYRSSAALFRSALDPTMLDICERILGPDVELFMDGQVLYKEATGGHPKLLHRGPGSYFTHRHQGPVAVLAYGVDTDLVNGALHVVPGSHRLGLLPHVDTFSHLGLEPAQWPCARALPVVGAARRDAIFVHVNTIPGSMENNSHRPRPAFIHRYRQSDDYVVVHGASTAHREAGAGAASQASKRNQRGLMVRGRRPGHF